MEKRWIDDEGMLELPFRGLFYMEVGCEVVIGCVVAVYRTQRPWTRETRCG
jgi:hypothetical protein